jgi:hypothetical protein
VLESEHVVLVHRLRLLVARGPGARLGLETATLIIRIVQLGERVRHLASGDVELEAVRHLGVVRVSPRQRRDFHRIPQNEGRGDELVLRERLEQLEEHLSRAPIFLRRESSSGGERAQRRFRSEVLITSSGVATHRVDQREPLPRRREIDLAISPAQPQTTRDPPREIAEELLGDFHEPPIVRIRQVELEERELGVVLRRHALVAKHP